MADDPSKPMNERQEWLKERLDLSPKEALKLAKQQWPTITLQSIYQLRNELRKRGFAVKKLTKGGFPIKHPERYAAKAASGGAASHERYKGGRQKSQGTEFILSCPASMSRDEVVTKGAQAGLTLTTKYVSTVRSRFRMQRLRAAGRQPPQAAQLTLPGEALPTPRVTRKAPIEAAVMPMGQLTADEADFLGLVLGIGINRAARLVAQFRVQFFDTIKSQTTTK